MKNDLDKFIRYKFNNNIIELVFSNPSTIFYSWLNRPIKNDKWNKADLDYCAKHYSQKQLLKIFE